MKMPRLGFSYDWADAPFSALIVQLAWMAALVLAWLFGHSVVFAQTDFSGYAILVLLLTFPSLVLALAAFPGRMSAFLPFFLLVLVLSLLGSIYTIPLLPIFFLFMLGGIAAGMVIGMILTMSVGDKVKERTTLGVMASLIVLLAVHLWYVDFWGVTLQGPKPGEYLKPVSLEASQQTRRLVDAATFDISQDNPTRAERILLRATEMQATPAARNAMEEIATLQIRLGNEPAAVAALGLEGDQRDPSSRLFLARVYLAAGNIVRAKALAANLSLPDRIQAHREIARKQQEDKNVEDARTTILELVPLLPATNPADAAKYAESVALALADLGFESDALAVARSHGGDRLPYILIALGAKRNSADDAASAFAEVAQLASKESDAGVRNSIRSALYQAQLKWNMVDDARSTVMSMANQDGRDQKWLASNRRIRDDEWRQNILRTIERLSIAQASKTAAHLAAPERIQAGLDIARRQRANHDIEQARATILELSTVLPTVSPGDGAKYAASMATALADLGFEYDALTLARSQGGVRLPYILIELGSARKSPEGAERLFDEAARIASAEADARERNSIRRVLYTAQLKKKMYDGARTTVMSVDDHDALEQGWRESSLVEINRISKSPSAAKPR